VHGMQRRRHHGSHIYLNSSTFGPQGPEVGMVPRKLRTLDDLFRSGMKHFSLA
jgi:hypothetical protein